MRIALFLFFVSSITALAAQQQPAPSPQAGSTHALRKLPADDVQALRQDLERMKALVAQMQSNLAFVDTTQSPLKHQFQLEIEMWNTMIASMERRLATASR
jgi:uncharacterized membrane protein YgcG